jgi:hypothetical protein
VARETTFQFLLERDAAVRVRFVRSRGKITSFVVQLECWIADHWYPVVRYDTAHGFAHCDRLHPDGTQEKQALPIRDFNEALTYAQDDLRANFRRYCKRFKEQFNDKTNR